MDSLDKIASNLAGFFTDLVNFVMDVINNIRRIVGGADIDNDTPIDKVAE